jgi:hypothetical protein
VEVGLAFTYPFHSQKSNMYLSFEGKLKAEASGIFERKKSDLLLLVFGGNLELLTGFI